MCKHVQWARKTCAGDIRVVIETHFDSEILTEYSFLNATHSYCLTSILVNGITQSQFKVYKKCNSMITLKCLLKGLLKALKRFSMWSWDNSIYFILSLSETNLEIIEHYITVLCNSTFKTSHMKYCWCQFCAKHAFFILMNTYVINLL
jgi:hypothetical protein